MDPLIPLFGGTTVLTAQVPAEQDGPPASTCSIEDDSGVPALRGLTSADGWRDAFIEVARRSEPTVVVIDLPSGPAIRAHWKRGKPMPATAWVVSDDDRVLVLYCRAERPPKDRWRSIAETFEFLPTEE